VARTTRPTVGSTLDAIGELAVGRCSGALQIRSRQSGTIFFVDGMVTYVEATGTPGAHTRLVRSGLIRPDDWPTPHDPDGSDLGVADALVSRHLVSRSQLLGVLRSVVLDAATAILDDGMAWEWRSQFAPDRRHWAASLFRTDPADLVAEATRRREALASLPVRADELVALRAAPPRGVVLDTDQWQLAALIDGRSTPRSLAWQVGQELFATTVTVASLIRRGACVVSGPVARRPEHVLDTPAPDGAGTATPTRPGVPTAGTPTTGAPERRSTPPSAPRLPRRAPGTAVWTDPEGRPIEPQRSGERPQRQTDPRLVRRILDALRQLE
jgi:hypothetical protein